MSDKQVEPETPGVLDPNVDAGLTREALYELVWSEPMLKVAAQFGVSSSYMGTNETHTMHVTSVLDPKRSRR